jgi:hypothetical protein
MLTACATADTVESITRAIRPNYEAYRRLPAFLVSYTIRNDFLRKRPRVFAYDECRVTNMRQGDMMRLSFRGTLPPLRGATRRGISDLVRDASWDGSTSMKVFDDVDDIYIYHKPPEFKYYYNYYSNYLYYPDGTGSVSRALGALAKSQPDAWLPVMLESHLTEYRLLDQPQLQDGVECQLVEKPLNTAIWVDVQAGSVIRRIDEFQPGSKIPRRRTTYGGFEDVGGAMLPRLIVQEQFADPRDPPEIQGQVCERNTLEVSGFSIQTRQRSEFRLPIPGGMRVHDLNRRITYVRSEPGDDPLANSVELARAALPTSSKATWPTSLIAVPTIFAVVLAIRWLRLRRP